MAARSKPAEVAGAIAHRLRDGQEVTMRAMGASAVNQSVKAIAIARSYLAADGIVPCVVPTMHLLEMGGDERTLIELIVRRG